MASFPWFRLYTEFATDPKVQGISEEMQRRLIMLFCLQGNGSLETLNEEDLSFALRVSKIQLQETKELFIQKKFIDKRWRVLNWEKRQCRSDVSTERVRAFRTRKKNDNETDETVSETFQKRDETVSETVGNGLRGEERRKEEIREEEEEEEKLEKKKTRFRASSTKRGTSLSVHFMVTDEHREYAAKNGLPNPDGEIEAFRQHHSAKGTIFKNWDSGFRNWLIKAKQFGDKNNDRNKTQKSKSAMHFELCGGTQGMFGEITPDTVVRITDKLKFSKQ